MAVDPRVTFTVTATAIYVAPVMTRIGEVCDNAADALAAFWAAQTVELDCQPDAECDEGVWWW